MDIVLEGRGDAWHIEVESSFPLCAERRWDAGAVCVAICASIGVLVDLDALQEANEVDVVEVETLLDKDAADIEVLGVVRLHGVGVSEGVT